MKYFLIMINFTYLFSITGLELATKMENRPKPIDIKSQSSMVLNNIDKKRTRTLKLINKSMDNSKKQMIWFLEPKDDYGIAFLKIEKDNEDDFMNMWLPGFNKTRRISSAKKTDSFMGSDLSFEDMTNRDLDEYTFEILDDNAKYSNDNDVMCYILSSIPKDPYSEYSMHKTWVDTSNFLALKEESYDKDNKILKTKKIGYQKIENFHIMNFLEVKNVQKNHSTILSIENIQINNGYSENMFHSKNLKRMPLD